MSIQPCRNESSNYRVVKLCQDTEKTFSNIINQLETELDTLETERNNLEAGCNSLRTKISKIGTSEKSWGTIAMVAQYVASAATIALGIASIATGAGTPAGVLLVASGVVGLTGRILQDTGALQGLASWMSASKEMQKRIVRGIDMGFFVTSLALGLSSYAFTSSPQIFATLLQTERARKIALGITYGAWAAKGGIDLRLAFLQKDRSEFEAVFKEMETHQTELFNREQRFAGQIKKTLASLQDMREYTKESIA